MMSSRQVTHESLHVHLRTFSVAPYGSGFVESCGPGIDENLIVEESTGAGGVGHRRLTGLNRGAA